MKTDSQGEWLQRFFSEGNGWDLQKILGSGYAAQVQAPLELMLQPALQNRSPAVIPWLMADTRLWFYVVADNRRELTEFANVIRAYLGSVRTRVDAQIRIDPANAAEAILVARWPDGFLKIDVPRELSQERHHGDYVFERLNRAAARYAERPLSTAVSQRPIGRILCDFFVACDRGDGATAGELVGELKASGVLSSRNLLSLELQVLGARGEWKALLGHPKLERIFSRRIPARVTELLLDAVSRTELRSIDPAEYRLEAISERLAGVAPLFLRSPGLAIEGNESRWKAWAIGAVALGYGRVLEAVPGQALGADWLASLVNWGGLRQEIPLEPLSGSPVGIRQDMQGAVDLLKRSLSLDPKEGLAIYEQLRQFPGAVLEEIDVHRSLGGVWRALQEDFEPRKGIGSWTAWATSLAKVESEQIAIDTLSEACLQWERATWDESSISSVLLPLADMGHTEKLREGIPILRKWLHDRGVEASASLITQFLLILAVDEVHSAQDLGLLADLIGDLTGVAHTKGQYRDAITSAVEIWKRTKSVRSLFGGLDVMDVLLDSVCADASARLTYWMALQEFCLAEWRRFTSAQQLLIREVSVAISGSSEQFPLKHAESSEAATAAVVDLGGKRLAIYTLTEGAARRAKSVLANLYPELDIQLNHDKSATSSLLNLTKTADYFIFSSQSAAHQAFYPVAQRRDDILYPAGKGASSIVRCFLGALET